jgi:hypothetical protein
MNGVWQRWKIGALALLMTAMAATTAGAAEGTVFVTGIDDLPLMDGLSETAGSALVFDSPAGRIVEAEASGAVSRDAVLQFYGATLPELGWTRDGETTFSRQDETLRLEIGGGGKVPIPVKFTLAPRAQ